MKKQLHFIFLSFFISFYSYTQCTLEMEDNITICTDSLQNGDFYLGDYFNIQGGTAPYEYTWSANYQFGLINTTASDILNDTTSANPNIIDYIDDSLTLYLEVTDANGQVCSDSTVIQFCSFHETTGPNFIYINQGDTTTLQPGVDGTCGITEYYWTPDYNLSDPNVPSPQASPDTTTHYDLTVIDANGCEYQAYGFTVYVNHVFPKIAEEGKRWTLSSHSMAYVDKVEYRIEGDSTLNGMVYKKLWRRINNGNWGISNLIRETDTGQLYQFGFQEELLFDFNLTVGDTLTNSAWEPKLIVMADDSIILDNGEKRRKLELHCENSWAVFPDFGDVWVEGIGSLNFGIGDSNSSWTCYLDVWKRLICHWENEEQIYMNPYHDSCAVTVPIIEIEDILYEINITPNPNNGIFSLDLPEIKNDVFLEIYDLSGRKIYDEHVDGNVINLNLGFLNNGMYFLVLRNDKRTFFRDKFLILK